MYTLTLININTKAEISKEEYETKKEAQKAKRRIMKEEGLINHGGYYVNYSEGVELLTNY